MIKTVCDELALSHFAMGFVLYYATGKNFRDGVHELFGRCSNIASRFKNASSARRSNFSNKRQPSRRLPENTQTTDVSHKPNDAPSITGQRPRPPNKLAVFGLRGGRKKDDFPGLDNCGHRGERQPSKLSSISHVSTTPSPV